MSMEATTIYLRKLRELRHVTQAELARQVGVHKRTIERFERYEGTIGADTFFRIRRVLGASIEHLTYLSDTPGTPATEAEDLAMTWVRQQGSELPTPQAWNGDRLDPWRRMPIGVRSYIQTLRQLVNYPVEVLEVLTGVSEAQWRSWEEGTLEDVPTKAFFIFIADLDASFDNVLKLIETNASAEEGRQLAERWFRQRWREPMVAISDDQDAALLKHTRWLNAEQKQRVLEYTNWIRSEIQELQMNLNAIALSDQRRTQFAMINQLSQQLTDALKQASWLAPDRWLWHIATLIVAERRHGRGLPEIEPERVQRALEEALVENQHEPPLKE